MYHGADLQSQFHPSGPMSFHPVNNSVYGYPTPPSTPPLQRQPTHLELCAPHMVQERILGTGAYGTVYLARDTTNDVRYAVKALNKYIDGRPVDLRTQHFQQTEMNLHYQASAHPNVVSLLRILETPLVTYVFLEYCPEGDLFTNITEHQRYTNKPQDAKDVFLQIVNAVEHCHNLGIYHRDLKPENILVAKGGNQVKLADFGLATTEPFSRDFGCGSTFYMSPECHDTTASKPFYACGPNDIWSLGVILVNLTCGRNPWKVASTRKDSTYRAFRANEDFLKDILPLSEELNDILKMIFTKDPGQRISLQELKQRIIACPTFSKAEVPCPIEAAMPQYIAPLPEVAFFPQAPVYPIDLSYPDVMDQDHTYQFNHANGTHLSQTSSHSSMESMESDHSDNSSAASEVGTPGDYTSSPAPPQVVISTPHEFYPSGTSYFPASAFKGLNELAYHATRALSPLAYIS